MLKYKSKSNEGKKLGWVIIRESVLVKSLITELSGTIWKRDRESKYLSSLTCVNSN